MNEVSDWQYHYHRAEQLLERLNSPYMDTELVKASMLAAQAHATLASIKHVEED